MLVPEKRTAKSKAKEIKATRDPKFEEQKQKRKTQKWSQNTKLK